MPRALFVRVWLLGACSMAGVAVASQRCRNIDPWVEGLRCETPATTLIELWLWTKRDPQAPIAHRFRLENLRRAGVVVHHGSAAGRALTATRESGRLELMTMLGHTYIENFDVDFDQGTVVYTQIFRERGSAPQFYVARGHCCPLVASEASDGDL